MPYQYPENVFQAIRSERQDFLENYIEIVPGYLFNQYETVKRAHLYYNSRFESGEYEKVNGVMRRKIFFNINKWRCDVATKMLDIDMKDYRLETDNYDQAWNVFILERKLKQWMRRNKFGKVQNQAGEKLPVYGSVVIEKNREGAEIIDLRYFFVDQAAPSLDKARYIIKKDFMSPSALRGMRGVWDNVDDVIERYCTFAPVPKKSYEDSEGYNKPIGTPEAEIYTRYAEVPLSWVTNKIEDVNEWVLAKFVVAGVDDVLRNQSREIIGDNGLVLWKEQIRKLPFKEVHYKKTEGRWLGIGVVEDTFQPQERTNEIKNQTAKSFELSFKHIYQSTEKVPNKNALTDLEEGQIIRSKGEIKPLDTVNRNWPAIQGEMMDYEKLADRLTFSYDIIRGEKPPASATATAITEQVGQATSVFDYKREDIGMFYEEFIKELAMPQFERELSLEEVFRFTGVLADLERARTHIARSYARARFFNALMRGRFMTKEEMGSMVEGFKNDLRKIGDKVWMKAKRDFFKNLDYHLDLDITGQSKNFYAQLQNTQAVLTILVKNPDVLKNPVLKKVFFRFLGSMGMSISELDELEDELTAFHNIQPEIAPEGMIAAPASAPAFSPAVPRVPLREAVAA